jgi:hypothetical protein
MRTTQFCEGIVFTQHQTAPVVALRELLRPQCCILLSLSTFRILAFLQSAAKHLIQSSQSFAKPISGCNDSTFFFGCNITSADALALNEADD